MNNLTKKSSGTPATSAANVGGLRFRTRRTLSAAIIALTWISVIPAANISWNGAANDGIYQTGGNWVGGVAPINGDWGDTAVFGIDGTPGTVTLSTGRKVQNIRFDTTGWLIDGAAFNDVRQITSSGAGVNTFDNTVNLYGNATWTVNTGNTLAFTDLLYLKGNTLSLTGGGTMSVDNSIGGFGSGTWGINIGQAQLQVNNSTLFAGATSPDTFIRLNDETSLFRFAGTKAQADAFILSGKIQKGALLNNLQSADIGGGYVQVSVIPEPGTLALVGISMSVLGLSVLRKRRV